MKYIPSIMKYLQSLFLSGFIIVLFFNMNSPLPNIGIRFYLAVILSSLASLWFALGRMEDRKIL